MMPGAGGKGSLVLFFTLGSVLFFAGVNAGYHAQPADDPHLTKSELDLPEAGETVHRDNSLIPNQYETNNQTVSPTGERLSNVLSTPLIWATNIGVTIGTHSRWVPSPIVAVITTGGPILGLLTTGVWFVLALHRMGET